MKQDFLQNFTQFGNMLGDLVRRSKPKEVIQGREEQQNPCFNDSSEGIQDILMLRMVSELSDDVVLNDNIEQITDDRTIQFQRNQHTIKKALDAYISNYGTMPTSSTLARITGLSRPTIYAHLKEGMLDIRFKEELAKLKLISTDLFAKLYQLAQNGDKQAIKMVMDLILGSGQKGHTLTQNNFIQVNTLKVSNDSFDKLTSRTKRKIELLISKDLNISALD